MKIAIFTDTYLPSQNGVSYSVKRQTQVLTDEGHEVLIVAINGTFADIKLKTIRIFRTRDRRYDIHLPISPLSCVSRKFTPDIVHIHTPFAIGIYGILFAKTYHIPTVYTHHTNFNYYLHYLRGLNNRLGRLITKYAYRKFLSTIPLIITPSLNSTKTLRVNFKLPKEKVVTIPTPVPVEEDLVITERTEKIYDLIFIGRIAREKNFSVVIEVVKNLMVRLPFVKIAFVGDGMMMKVLRKELSEYIGNNVLVFGELSNSEVLKRLEMSKYLFFPSFSETQGLVVQEGWSRGVPVIGIKCDLMNEYVKEGKNGWIISNCVQKLTNKTCELIMKGTNPCIQSYCRQSAKNFSPAIWYEKYNQSMTKLYLEV